MTEFRNSVKAQGNAQNPKYHNKKTFLDGIWFDSKKEAQFYLYLKAKKQKGEIHDFQVKPNKLLIIPGDPGVDMRPAFYCPDFLVYFNEGTGKDKPELKCHRCRILGSIDPTCTNCDGKGWMDWEYVDVKGYRTDVFLLKMKLVYEKYKFIVRLI